MLCRENNGADQLHKFCPSDLHFCYHTDKNRFYHDTVLSALHTLAIHCITEDALIVFYCLSLSSSDVDTFDVKPPPADTALNFTLSCTALLAFVTITFFLFEHKACLVQSFADIASVLSYMYLSHNLHWHILHNTFSILK